MGLGLGACLDVFDYRAYSPPAVREKFQQLPRTVCQTSSFAEEELLRAPWHKFFRLHRLRGRGEAQWVGGELMLLITLAGAGELSAARQTRPVRAGETWLLPGAAKSWEWRSAAGDWELLLAKLPLPRSSRGNEAEIFP